MSHRPAAGLASLVLALAGCLAPAGLDFSAAPDASTPASGSPGSVADCPNYVTAVETGPPPTDVSEDGPLAREQARLEADIQAVVAYTQAHADEFGSIRFENSPRVRIVVGFTAQVAKHCAALRAILEYPDEFEIVLALHTDADLRRLMDEIIARARPHMRSVGLGATQIHVHLRADGEALAAELAARYGALVSITVGLLPYPDRTLAASAQCQALGGPVIGDSPFRVTVNLADQEIRSGEDFSGTVTVTNAGDATVAFESGQPHVAVVYRVGGDAPVAVYEGPIAGTGTGATLEVGGSLDMDFLGGTASCDPALGYALPPGEYEVRIPVEQYAYPDPNAGVVVTYLLSEPAPLTIVP